MAEASEIVDKQKKPIEAEVDPKLSYQLELKTIRLLLDIWPSEVEDMGFEGLVTQVREKGLFETFASNQLEPMSGSGSFPPNLVLDELGRGLKDGTIERPKAIQVAAFVQAASAIRFLGEKRDRKTTLTYLEEGTFERTPLDYTDTLVSSGEGLNVFDLPDPAAILDEKNLGKFRLEYPTLYLWNDLESAAKGQSVFDKKPFPVKMASYFEGLATLMKEEKKSTKTSGAADPLERLNVAMGFLVGLTMRYSYSIHEQLKSRAP